MQQNIYTIKSNEKIAEGIYKAVLMGDTDGITQCGQFVNILLPGFYLRRPISICDYSDGEITLVYKIVGEGTEFLSKLEKGYRLDMLVGLGNGFKTCFCGKNPIIVGGGVGVAPLYCLAKTLVKEGKKPTVVLGFNSKDEAFLIKQFADLSLNVLVSTVDGSLGVKGFVTDIIKGLAFDYFFACGPTPMLKALSGFDAIGQLSIEQRMACGFGACMCCSVKTANGAKRVCKDGPVFMKEELIWQ